MDGFEGLAAAILLGMVCMLVVPAAMFGGLGYWALAKRKGWLGAMLGVLFGLAVGGVAVGFTFFEDTMRPPPHLAVTVPSGFAHEWVFFIADPAATAEIEWHGGWSPSAEIAVPRSGVLRVRDLGYLDGQNPTVTLPDGRTQVGSAGLNAPPGIGSGRLVAFCFVSWPGTEPDVGSLDEAALAARIRELETEP